MEEQYGITDLTHYMNGRVFTAVPQPPPQPQQQQPPHDLHYDMVMMGGGGGGMMFRSDSTTGTGSTTASLSAGGGGGGLEMEIGGGLEMEIGGGGGGGNGRWPRQETLTLLEVRSRLDSKFKEANQKGPLWDEVSRIMSEEHGYQRSGKKCREKFENLYKYYKKTKEGKAGRQDGKHYRFFRQLEALYGETSTSISIISPNVNPNPNVNPPSFSDPHNFNVETCALQGHPHPNNSTFEQPFQTAHSPSLSNNSSPFDTSSSGYTNPNAAMPTFLENGDSADRIMNKRRLGKRSWKAKIKDFIDAQMRKIMEKQEEWMEKMMKSIEQKEEERVLREEQWRKEEASRFEKEHKFWANERAWMESRDSALMEALHKLTDKESNRKSSPDDLNLTSWGENEITRLIQIRTSMETRFEQGRYVEELLWEEIASKMACLGYSRNGVTCKNKWDNINEFLMRTKKRKENNRSSNSYTHHNNESLSHIVHHQVGSYRQNNDQNNDGSYRFLMGDPENVWDGYGMKVGKDEEH